MTPWGAVETAFNPCSVLPEAARRLAGSTCEATVSAWIDSARTCLQYCYCEDESDVQIDADIAKPVRQRLEVLVDTLRSRRLELALHVLGLDDESQLDAERLAAALSGADPGPLWAALVFVGQRRERALAGRVIEGIGSWPWGVQLAGIGCLLRLEEPASESLLAKWVKRKQVVAGLRRSIARCLGEVGDVRAVKTLIQVAKKAESLVAEQAERALLRVIERSADRRLEGLPALVAALACDAPQVRSEAQRELAGLGRDAAPPLARALATSHDGQREAVLDVLIRLGKPAVPPLIGVLDGQAAPASVAAARGLGAIGDRQGVGPLVSALDDSEPAVAKAGAGALGKIGDVKAAPPLLAALTRPQPDVRLAVAGALCTLLPAVDPSGESGFAILTQAAGVDQSSVAIAAAGELGKSKRAEAVRPLVRLLGAADPWVAAAAAKALASFRDPRAVRPLTEALDRPESAVHDAAADTLLAMLRDFARQGPAALPLLLELLAAPDARVCAGAAWGLARIGDRRALPKLVTACLTREDATRELAGALAQLADAGTIKLLTHSLELGDRRVARGAVEALVAIGRPAVRQLVKALKWQYPAARAAAAEALRRIGDPASESAFRSAIRDTDRRVAAQAAGALAELKNKSRGQ